MTLAAAILAVPMSFAQVPEALYVVGENNGWSVPADDAEPTVLTNNGEGIFTGTVTCAVNPFKFKLFTSIDANWNTPEEYFGINTDEYHPLEANVPYTVEGFVFGNGSKDIVFSNWAPYGTGTITVDWNAQTITVESDLVEGEAPAHQLGENIYLVGAPQGWDINNSSMKLPRVSDGVYEAIYKIPAGQFQFRFYAELGDWNNGQSIGSQVDDSHITIQLNDNAYNGPCVWGKGSWNVSNWPGGDVKMTVNLNAMTVNFNTDVEIPEPGPFENTLFIVGNVQGWDINNGDMPLTYNPDTKLYTATYEVSGQNVTLPDKTEIQGIQFRFYKVLGDWESNSIGSQIEDLAIYTPLVEGVYTGECFDGKGSWAFNWESGEVYFEVDLENMTVKFEDAAAGVEILPVQNGGFVYSNGIVAAPSATEISVFDLTGKLVAKANAQQLNIENLPAGIYIVAAPALKPVKIVK